MRILLLTPLFPPDTGDPAPYVKELSKRLSATNTTTVLMYGRIPESVEGVCIDAIDKRAWLPLRLFRYTSALLRYTKTVERIVVQNAPSTELPALIVSFFSPTPMILCESDPLAKMAAQSGTYRFLHALLKHRCAAVITLPAHEVYKKAEILPFSTVDEQALAQHERWWSNHLNELTTI